MSYFDHNATTPLDPQVLDAMLPYLKQNFGNPSSLHGHGRLARTAISRARQQVAALVNARPDQVLFTSCGTEANNLALKGSHCFFSSGRVGMSAIEHASILEQQPAFQAQGCSIELLPVDSDGVLCLQGLKKFLNKEPHLLTVMSANNESGVLQDIPRIAALVKKHSCLLHVDASQSAGKVTLDFTASQIHLMTISAHKMYGPKGVGALIFDDSVDLQPLLHGGGHEFGYRSGTENVSAIVGFGQAAELAQQRFMKDTRHQRRLRDMFEDQLLYAIPETVVFSCHTDRLPNTCLFSLPGWHGETVVMELDRQGFSVSSGSACKSGVDEPSHVLRAMNVPDDIALGAVRVSFGRSNTAEEVTHLLDAVVALSHKMQAHNQLVDW